MKNGTIELLPPNKVALNFVYTPKDTYYLKMMVEIVSSAASLVPHSFWPKVRSTRNCEMHHL